ncbi:MAG: hypothetical protein KAT15_12715, partial [Bacteroidales bacterium]|nr:hypothetical protein [Bacteroidales bacterium]
MKLNKLNILIAGGLILGGLSGCFEEDEMILPHIPGDEQTYVFKKSIYTNQSFFDLGSNDILSENENSVWVLRFASQAEEWH